MSESRWRRWLRELATEVGAVVEHTRGGHLAIVHPSGWVVYTSATPSDERTCLHTRAQVRRAMRVRVRI